MLYYHTIYTSTILLLYYSSLSPPSISSFLLVKNLYKKPKHWYVSDGVSVRHIRTTRMLRNYQNEFGKLNLPVDTMYIVEIEAEFGRKIDINSGEFK
ncbi:N-acetylmuramoyl-L-alanine amidase [Lactococcus phage CHPC967]|uniref:N-acetylmuramoyl-L-alanine amidase n=1 Tax=Lactococcus phage CHPC967 TaxID=2675259 RepID=A0A650EVA6_9CAUD|nr:N-acetylmuramoyl-L-alanine amidase [Lactococcus phage CHPC967]QGT53461.1 N-acetylmuramoyl-L-alanine amidase [Lactococcus phage CHPC967]